MRTNEATSADSLRYAIREAYTNPDEGRRAWFAVTVGQLAEGLPEAVVESIARDVGRALRAEGRATR